MATKKLKDFLKADFLEDIMEAAYNMWRLGWAERNAGNISYLIDEKTAKKYFNINKSKRTINLNVTVNALAGKIFLVTGTGRYFKNLIIDPSNNLGVIRISEKGDSADIIWGFDDGGGPTSELSAHLLSHNERLKADPEHRIIIHTHTSSLVAMSILHEIDDDLMTRTLWGICSECIVVFPEGVGVLPWMVPGTLELGKKTAEKMSKYRIVVWPFHGIFCSGKNVDETMGLIETVEKAADIFIKINSCGKPKNSIGDGQLKEIADFFKLTPKSGIIDK
jgi:rhamnulose-1-phosphate aldolase